MKDWIIGSLGEPTELQYKGMHLITTAIIIVFVIIFSIIASSKKISDKAKDIILKCICIFHITFEVLWRVLYIIYKDADIAMLWPMYPCNLGGILLPIISLFNLKIGKKMFYLFGFFGACMTFIIPAGIFIRTVMTFPILKSVLQHTGLLLIPTFEYFSKKYRPYVGDFLFIILGCIIHTINCEVIDRWLGLTGDYMFYRSGMPFVIPGVPKWITISVFVLAFLYICSFVLSFKESVDYYKTNKWKEKYNIKNWFKKESSNTKDRK